MKKLTGRIGRIETCSGVDGPGIRMIVFMAGCDMRCVYCQNPELWDGGSSSGAFEMTAVELAVKAGRYSGYFGTKGGVTFSGGEPLLQPDFVFGCAKLLHDEKISSALETSGSRNDEICESAAFFTDYVMCDVKFADDDKYKKYCGGSLTRVTKLLDAADRYKKPVLLRHVVVPGISGTSDELELLKELWQRHPSVVGVEFLPFRTLCLEKYSRLGLVFPLAETPECASDDIDRIRQTFMSAMSKASEVW